MKAKNLLGLDIGTRRIVANSSIKIAIPLTTIEVNDGDEILQINKIIVNEKIDTIVAGLPRNMSGEETAQSVYTKEFLENFKLSVNEIKFQDESLTSVQAENILKSYKKPYTKGDIDMQAAAIILQDYLEENF